jgi:flagellar motility protein MotE (MotC chaperone)
MMRHARPLPYAIAVMTLLVGVKTAGLVHAFDIGSPARASAPEKAEGKERAEGKPAAAHGAKAEVAAPAAAPVPAPEKPADPPISEAEKATLQDLRARRKELDTRAARLDDREAMLTAAERRLTERVEQLTALQTKLERLEKDRQDRQDANWRGLVRTYEDMRPRDAATIFNDLDSAVLIQVLDRMKDAKAAPILAAMTPERARAATSQLAQFRTQASAAPRIDVKEVGQKQ